MVVLRLPFDPGRRIPRDLLVIDSDAEDEREGRLPTVPARRFPTARLGLLGQPADYLLFGDLLSRPLSEDGKEFIYLLSMADSAVCILDTALPLELQLPSFLFKAGAGRRERCAH